MSPATVEQVVGAVGSKASLKQSNIGYVTVTVDPINKEPFYGVYPASGIGHYQANINGSNLKSIEGSGGGASGSAASGIAASGGGAASSGPSSGGGAGNPQAIADCVSKAGGDPTKIAKCAGGG